MKETMYLYTELLFPYHFYLKKKKTTKNCVLRQLIWYTLLHKKIIIISHNIGFPEISETGRYVKGAEYFYTALLLS